MHRWEKWAAATLLAASSALAETNLKQELGLDAAKRAFEASEYTAAIQLLQVAAAKDPRDAEVQLLLTKSYIELEEHDAAVKSAERAVAIEPGSSLYHEWLGRAYGEKANHAGWMFSAISLAKKTRKEFETAVKLDGKNYSARQALIEFDCTAPGVVGGGEDKAQPQIKELMELDTAEGHYAAGNCRRQKKDFEAADAEFTKSLESQPKSADLIYDIGDYAVRRGQAERLAAVAKMGKEVAPKDPRAKFYGAVGLVLKKEEPEEAERLLRDYLKTAPTRSGYPRPGVAHAWLGRLFEGQGNHREAETEFEAALKLEPKNKMAQEALKRLKKG